MALPFSDQQLTVNWFWICTVYLYSYSGVAQCQTFQTEQWRLDVQSLAGSYQGHIKMVAVNSLFPSQAHVWMWGLDSKGLQSLVLVPVSFVDRVRVTSASNKGPLKGIKSSHSCQPFQQLNFTPKLILYDCLFSTCFSLSNISLALHNLCCVGAQENLPKQTYNPLSRTLQWQDNTGLSSVISSKQWVWLEWGIKSDKFLELVWKLILKKLV